MGDFGSAGAAEFHLLCTVNRPFTNVEYGANGLARLAAGRSIRLGGGDLLLGGETREYDGPWVLKENIRKFSGISGKHLNTLRARWSSVLTFGKRAANPEQRTSRQVPLRSFKDASGVHWDVWEAHPRLQERRTTEERRVIPRPEESPRRAGDRRTSPASTESEGWLVFHSDLERRLQRPISPGWDKLTDVELENLMLRARPSGPRSRSLE